MKKISHAGTFTAKQVEDLKRCVKGIPLFYDDIISKTFNEHAVKLDLQKSIRNYTFPTLFCKF